MSGGGSSSGGQTQTTEPWSYQRAPLRRAYDRAELAYDRGPWETYGEISPAEREKYVKKTTGIDVNNANALRAMGLDAGATNTAVETGGFVPFTGYERQAQQQAVNLANQGPDPYLRQAQAQLASNPGLRMLQQQNPGMAVLGSNAGIDMLAAKNPAYNYLRQGARGDYLTADTNPYLAGAVKAAQDPLIQRFNTEVLPGVTSQFGEGGRFGSGAHQAAVSRATQDFGKALSDSATQAYAQNYSQERQNQLAAQQQLGNLALSQGQALGQLQLGQGQALGELHLGQGQALSEAMQRNAALAPQLSDAIYQQRLKGLELLEGVGGAQAAKAEQLGTMQADPYLQQQKAYDDMVARYASLVQGNSPGGTVSMGGGGGSNRTAGALGGAATGASAGMMVGGPWGAAIGGVLGGLGGAFL